MIRRFTNKNGFMDSTLYIEYDEERNRSFLVSDYGRKPSTSYTLDICLKLVNEGSWAEIIFDPDEINSLVKFPGN